MREIGKVGKVEKRNGERGRERGRERERERGDIYTFDCKERGKRNDMKIKAV
jgi:hypothetical protein